MNNRNCYNFDALKGLRVIGAFIIVLFHYNKLTSTSHMDLSFPFYRALKFPYMYGGILVENFFLISGICFYQFYSERIMEGRVSVRVFLKKRCLKLWPLYIVTTIMTLILQLIHFRFFGNYFEDNFRIETKYIILNFLGIARGWYENYSYPYNAPAWFLSVLVLMYILFSMICMIAGMVNSHKNEALYVLTVLLLVSGLIFRHKNYQYKLINTEMGRGLSCFFLGGVLFFILNKADTIRKKKVLMIHMSLFCIGVSLVMKFYGKNLLNNANYMSMVVFPTIIILSIVSESLGNILSSVTFMQLDKITYEIYLMQYPYFILWRILGNIFELNFYSISFWLVFWMGLLAGSYGIHYMFLLEKE